MGDIPTQEQYAAMKPFVQGWMTYMHAEWPGAKIPKECPYLQGTDEAKEWNTGNFAAMFEVQDGEE